MKLTRLLAASAVALVALSIAAAAQTALAPVDPAPNAIVDITPITNSIIPAVGSLLGLLLSALVGFAIRWVNSKTHLVNTQTADAVQQVFSEQIAHMMAYGESVVKGAIPAGGKVEIDNAFVRKAVEYGVKAYPDTIGKMDLDAVARAVIARIPSGPMTETATAITVAKAAPVAVAVSPSQ